MQICYYEDFIQKLTYLVNISEKISNMNKLMHTRESQNCTKETQNITFLTCFLLLENVILAMKQKLTKKFYQVFGCFAETVCIVL
jgi:hypothetical protein